MAFSRRAFLGKSGGALALGAVVAGTPLSLAAAEPAQSSAQPSAPGLEKWLLETGRDQMDHDAYEVAARKIR